MRVLIIKASALGDVIHALPVLDYLHQVSAAVEVDWVVEEQFREILEGHPQLGLLHVVRTRAWRKAPLAAATRREVAELRARLRERHYDLVFDIQGNVKSGLIAWLSGAANRIGFARDAVREAPNLLFTTRQIPLRRQDYHVTDKYLRLVSVPFGRDFATLELRSTIATRPEDDAAAEALLLTLGDGLVFLCHCGTSWRTKLWAEERWVELGLALQAAYPDVSLLLTWGSEAERQTAVVVAKGIGGGARVLDRYPLKGLAALMKRVDLVVAGDTGPLHIAAAVGTPTVSFFRATDAKLTGPRGENHVAIQAPLDCTRCARKECARDRECRESITVPMVMAGIGKVLGNGV
jgi:lipopolysaccharide heptosyltransferase I